jgi:hypothetical protein
MANSMTGKILAILPTETIVSKKDSTKTFHKRTLVLDCTRYDQYTGDRGYDNFPAFEFSGDKCAELDQYKPGQIVTVSFDLQGSKFVGDNGKERWFTSIRGYKIELRQSPQPIAQQPMQQPQAVNPPQPQWGTPQPTPMQQAQMMYQPTPQPPQPAQPINDLPWD